ncbi:hypothetical protein ASD21_14490 [Caulobacter sp. Root1455]|uniref:DUF2125 domain-containing protein n=1 Tax=Caulobacter sp. Root1455 TaxID=1736465 RepID=UPI0007014CFC|nr:DUF2125 domain-containing protein [Caulobacter sp. Root1455]KQY92590.1 hypothetical protein ASD21_14490 [Caulobacter sp. Root1455]
MTHNAAAPSRKPRRRGLLAPFVLLAIVAIGWSIGWLWLRGQAEQRMDATALSLKSRGYDLSWENRTFSGYPFRLDVTLTNARVAEPSGWALRAPELKGEANAYNIGHWVIVAPQGVIMTRPINGDVAITGQALRASFTGFNRYPPRISVEGANLIFTPMAGAAPFPLLSTAGLQLHVRPGPDDQGAIFFEAKGAKARFTGLMGRIAADRTADLIWDSKVSKISALHGTSWADAVEDWSDAGGTLTVQQGKLNAGEALLEAKSGALTVDDDGRLRGALDVTVREIPTPGQALKSPEAAAAAVAQALGQDPTLSATLTFQNGRTRLGLFDTGPAPRVY